jgi:oxygen-independent coproporphyrinogen-3 oxidase
VNYDINTDTRSLYIHWPFCPYRCHFCPFVALASHEQFMERYHRALCKEIENFKFSRDQEIDTIFLGGGTPSTYPDELLLDTFGRLKERLKINWLAEVTIEVNPGTVRSGQLALWKGIGINRLSIGVQSLNNLVLKKLNRHQSADDVYDLLDQAHDHFENISVDLILGLPGVSSDEWKELIHTVCTWPIKHISLYFLMVHENTPLYFGVKTKKVALFEDDEIVDVYSWSIATLQTYGFEQYEVSNFARPGFESRHNTMYWNRKPYKGFGLGACSFDGERRFKNETNLMNYLNNIEQDREVTIFEESLTQEQVYLEKVMLGLRKREGVALDELLCGVTIEKKNKIIQKVAEFKQEGLLAQRNGRVVLTPAGLAVENEIIVQLSL